MRLDEDGWFFRTHSEADGANPTDFGDEGPATCMECDGPFEEGHRCPPEGQTPVSTDAVPVVIEDQPTERLPRESNEQVVRGGLR